MIQSIIMMLLIMLTIMFYQIKHPLTMGLILIIKTMLICLLSGYIYENFWFSYILFLIFVGGMLVMFIYMTSMVNNEMFYFSFNYICMIMFMLMIILLMLFNNDLNFFNLSFINNNEMMNSLYLEKHMETSFCINKLYNFPTNLNTIMMMNYLLFTLIIIVKMTNLYMGPVRNLN